MDSGGLPGVMHRGSLSAVTRLLLLHDRLKVEVRWLLVGLIR